MRLRFSFQDQISRRLSSTLDLARWVAAALVLIFHIRLNVLVDTANEPSSLTVRALYLLTDCGSQAVVWFFVLSGFLVGGSVVADLRRDRFSFRRYAVSRVSRLYAVLIPALVIGIALDQARVALHGDFMPGAYDSAASHTPYAFFANVLCLQTIIAPTLGSNNPLWSLAYEAWYYLLFPLLIAPFMGGRSRTARMLLFAGGIAALVFLHLHNPRLVRSFALWLLGLMVRFFPAPLMRSAALAWVLAVIGMIAYPLLFPRLGSAATLLVGLPFANLLLTLQHEASTVPLPGARLYTALAGFSFSLYLVHAPALHFALTLINGTADPALHMQPVGWTPWAWGVALFLGLALYAWLFSRLTETHTDQVRAFLSRRFSSSSLESR